MATVKSPINHYTPHLSPIVGMTSYTSESSAENTPRPRFRLQAAPSLVDDDEQSLCSDDYEVLSPHAIENLREEMRQMYEEAYDVSDSEEEDFAVALTTVDTPLVARHPRVLLAYLRFIDLYNEVAKPEEVLPPFKMSHAAQAEILYHSTVFHAPREFKQDVDELRARILSTTD
jgi:hypothetical protein